MINGKILVHLRAPAMTNSGYGAHGREVLDYLLQDDKFLVALESINWGNCGYISEKSLGDSEKYRKYLASIALWEEFKGKDLFDIAIHVSIPNEFIRSAKFNIGVTAGIETDRVSREWVTKCNEMDVVIVPSEHSAKVLQGTVYQVVNNQTGETIDERMTKPLLIIPEFFDKPKVVKPLDMIFETDKNLLFVGLWGGKGGFGEDRKNIADLIKLFISEFKDDSKVGLVLKTQLVNGCQKDKEETVARIKEIKKNFGGDIKCKIHLIHQDLTEEEMWGLYSHPQVTGFVSLTHGEGFGRPLLEANACGKPVLATNWSGHVDFLSKKGGFIPLEHSMIPVPECQHWDGVITKDSMWAKVDDKNARKRMRKFLESPRDIQVRAEQNVDYLVNTYSRKSIYGRWDEFFGMFIKHSDQKPQEDVTEEFSQYESKKREQVEKLRSLIDSTSKKSKVLYVMPQSAGDCLISTAIVHSLIANRHMDSENDFYVATSPQFAPLFDALVDDFGVKVIDYDPSLMFQAEVLKEVWDYVYSPGINVQFTFSNWLLGNGEYSVRLLEEFAKQCNLMPRDITNYRVNLRECEIPGKSYVVMAPGGQKSAKTYKYWPDIINNVKSMLPDVDIIQIGAKDEALIPGLLDYRGREFAESFFIIKNALMLIGVDSFPGHAAAAMETPHLLIYSSTHAETCSPVLLGRKKVPQIAIEETDRCNPKCYKDQCKKAVDGKNCLSYISQESICNGVELLIKKILQEGDEDENNK